VRNALTNPPYWSKTVAVKHLRIFLITLAAGIVLPACKSPEPTFGIPDEPQERGLGRIFNEQRSQAWREKRASWARREREKSQQMFDRMKEN